MGRNRHRSRPPRLCATAPLLLAGLALGAALLGSATASEIVASASSEAEASVPAGADPHGGSELTASLLERFGWEVRITLPPAPELEDYIGFALVHSPAVQAARERWQAALAVAPQAGAWPDPRFVWGEMIVPVETRTGPQQRVFSLSQTVPWFGKPGLKSDVAAAGADIAEARLAGEVLAAAAAVREIWYELAYLAEAIAITEKHHRLLLQWTLIARTRYEAGSGSYAALLKAQMERDRLDRRLAELRDLRHPAAVSLNATLGRSGAQPVVWPERLPAADDVAVTAGDPDLLAGHPDLLADKPELLADNPELLALVREEIGFERAGALAHRERFPDLTLGLDYIQTGPALDPDLPDSGRDPVIARIGINIPLWQGERAAAEREAASRGAATALTRRDRRGALEADLARQNFRWREARRTEDLYGTSLLPRARQALEAVDASYQAGTAGYLDLLEAQRTLLSFELTHVRARADRLVALARLETLVAGPLDAPATGLEAGSAGGDRTTTGGETRP